MIHLGCAGWSLSGEYAADFPEAGTHLQRYARVLNAVEINSSFYRPHRPATYARWGESVPEGFRFSVKVPKAITHERRLLDCEAELEGFLAQCGELGERLGCLLVQLPPSLAFEPVAAARFFAALRAKFDGAVAIEPRHGSWAAAGAMLTEMQVAQVAADPARFGADAEPGGWPGLVYWRLHGAPRIYFSAYCAEYLDTLAVRLEDCAAAGVPVWCIFDNTAAGAALGDALVMRRRLNAEGRLV